MRETIQNANGKQFHAVSLSGGKDSTAMLLLMIERDMPINMVLSADTGMEFPEMYEHLAKLDEHLFRERGIHITTLRHPKGFEYLMFDEPKQKPRSLENRAKLGIPPYGNGWPGIRVRWCTGQLKTHLITKEVNRLKGELGAIHYVGIAADEAWRCKDERYPLVEWGITEAQALQACYDRGFDFGGLYEIYHRASCWCCPFQRIDELRKLRKHAADYISEFRRWVSQGFCVVHFCISGDFSSTYQNACLAAKEVGNVYVVDSRNLSTGQGLLVLHAAEMVEKGHSAQEIWERCTALAAQVEASFVIDRLDYLHKGGRCSALGAFGGNLLRLKPCIEVRDGKMIPGKKYRGRIEKVMLQYVEDRLQNRSDIDKHRIFITHTRCSPEAVSAVREKIRQLIPDFEEILETTAGATITSHCGPNTLGILFLRKDL